MIKLKFGKPHPGWLPVKIKIEDCSYKTDERTIEMRALLDQINWSNKGDAGQMTIKSQIE
ncbi:hypothetical protein ACFLXQ_04400 [Chloroflexota bacterium]